MLLMLYYLRTLCEFHGTRSWRALFCPTSTARIYCFSTSVEGNQHGFCVVVITARIYCASTSVEGGLVFLVTTDRIQCVSTSVEREQCYCGILTTRARTCCASTSVEGDLVFRTATDRIQCVSTSVERKHCFCGISSKLGLSAARPPYRRWIQRRMCTTKASKRLISRQGTNIEIEHVLSPVSVDPLAKLKLKFTTLTVVSELH